eukprot:780921-Amorphochlora_amoeboformis.AAC.1
MFRPSMVQTLADIGNHFCALPPSMGAGSSTALMLGARNEEPSVEELNSFLDSSVYIDEKLAAKNMVPGVALRDIAKSTPSPFQLPMVREFFTRIFAVLRNTHSLAERAKVADSLGIDLIEEESVEDELEFVDKIQTLINKRSDLPLQIQLIALYFASKSLLIGVEENDIHSYEQSVADFIERRRPELTRPWKPDREIPGFIFDDLDLLAQEYFKEHVLSH